MPTADEIADADRQFWNLAREIRRIEAAGAFDPDLASYYEDADYLAHTALTPGIRVRCAALVDDWRRRGGAPSPFDAGGRAPA